jgi:HlyD family secretion protein
MTKSRQPQKGAGVWILEKGKPRRLSVEIGISDGSFTEIAGGELREGQDVVTEETVVKTKEPPRAGPRMF